MIVFFILLTLGFIFELGKNALSIESKQTTLSNSKDTTEVDIFLYGIVYDKPFWLY
jgi:hypothetical protein